MASRLKRSLRIWEFGYRLGRHYPDKDAYIYFQRLDLMGLWRPFVNGWREGYEDFIKANLRLPINKMLLEILDE